MNIQYLNVINFRGLKRFLKTFLFASNQKQSYGILIKFKL